MNKRLPINTQEFWANRLEAAIAKKQLHRSLFDVDHEQWIDIQSTHASILQTLFHPYERARVLDAGCGYGALTRLLPTNIDYVGADISKNMIGLAQESHPSSYQFLCADLMSLPFKDRSFDLAICRSVDGMVKEHMGIEVWRLMERELLRVADRLVLLNYSEPDMYRVHEASVDPEEKTVNTVQIEGSRLSYRPGQDGTCELYDLLVTEANRRQGIASRLVMQVVQATYGTVYGFCRADNAPVKALYRKLGFCIIPLPCFYRGQDGFMIMKEFARR